MTSIISYAQNFEDVMLWRALGQVENGFYIDIGAQDPIIDSVSLAFHEHGWRGIHVEPTPHYAELLRQQRPGDTVIQAAVGNGPAALTFFEIPDTGISTADPVIAQQHQERGFDVHEITVPCITLAAIFASCTDPEIHWLKIDVEGFEQQVLSSWDKSKLRPWVVVVESTLPLTQIETNENWEGILIGYGYSPVYFDGLNRYYVSSAHPELKDAFRSPPNVFDGFTLNGTASNPIHHLMVARHKQQINGIVAQNEQQKLANNHEIERLTLSLTTLEKTHAEHEQNLTRREQEIAAQLLAIQQQANQEKAEQERGYSEQEHALQRQHVEREHIFTQQLQAGQQELRHLEQERAQREKEHAQQTRQIQQELENLLRTQIQREQEVAAQLLAIQQHAAQEIVEQARSHSDQAQDLQRQHIEREQTLSQQHQAQLQDIQRQQAEHEWLTAERIHTLNIELHRLQADNATREHAHANIVDSLQKEITTLLRMQVQREQEIAAQLLAMQQHAGQEKAEQEHNHSEQVCALQRNHAEREQTLNQQLQARQQELHSLELTRADMQHQLNAQLQAEREAGQQLQQVLTALQAELATLRNGLSWRLTAPLRAVVGWFKPAPAQIGHTISAAEQPIVATLSPTESYPATPDNQELTSNSSLSETTSMTSNHTAQAPQRTPSSTAPNLSMLLHYQDRQFVEFAYLTLLKRLPDAEGLNYYLARLRAGIPKIQILGQLLDSDEARVRDIVIPGLRDAVQWQKLARLPLIGAVIKYFIKIEGNSPFENRLRAIEQQIFLLEKQFDGRFERIDKNLNSLEQLIIQQSQQLLTSLQQPSTTVAPVIAAIEPVAELTRTKASGDFSHELLPMTLAEVNKWSLGRRVNE